MRNLTMQNTRTRLSVAIASALLATSGVAQAQLEEIVVTAQKREQNLQEVPISVAVMSAESMEKQNINDTTSLALSVPSLSFQEGFAPSATTFSIRGVSSYTFTGGIQPSVSMVVDGVAFARAGEYLADLPDVERVEVLRGPQGTLFGRNSTAGVINITTRAASDELMGNISYSYTDEEEHLLKGYVSGPISDSVRYSLAGFTQDRDDYVDNINPKGVDAGGQESWGGRAKLDVDFSDNVNVVFSADYRELDFNNFPLMPDIADDLGPAAGGTLLRELAQGNGDPALGREVLADRFTVNINEREEGDAEMESWGLSADVTWNISDSLTFKSITAYREWEELVNADIDGSGIEVANGGYGALPVGLRYSNLDNDYVGIPMYRDFENEYITQEFRLENVGDSVDWVAGVFFQDFEESTHNNFHGWFPFIPEVGEDMLISQFVDNGSELTAASVFGDVTFHLTNTLDVYGGLRISYEDVEVNYNTMHLNAPGSFGVFTLDAATNTVNIDTSNPAYPLLLTPFMGPAEDDDTDWSGRLGFNWHFSEDASLYGQISRGYVGIGALLNNTASPDNAFVDPTTAEAIEFGVKSELFDGRLRLNGAIFYQEVTDLQTSIFPPGGFNTLNVNAGDTETLGLEIDALWAVTDYFQLSAALTYLDAEMQDLLQECYPDQPIESCNLDANGNITSDPTQVIQYDVSGLAPPNAPELAYNISADFFAPLGDLPFEGYARIAYTWQDDITFALNNDPLLTQEAYGLLDITMGISDKEGRYDISLFGKNVTDEEFINDAIELVGFSGRRLVRLNRAARDYYGIKFQWNFGAL